MKALDFLHEHGLDEKEMLDFWRFPELGSTFTEFQIRDEYIQRFGFAILTKDTIEKIRPYAPLLELGAGSGYWSYELQQHGIDVIATDPATENFGFFTANGFEKRRWKSAWTEVETLDAIEAVKKYPRRNLLLVWPSIGDSWSADALKLFSGNTVIYVGEGHGGCTADDDFHELLDSKFADQKVTPIPAFFGIHDRLHICNRAHG